MKNVGEIGLGLDHFFVASFFLVQSYTCQSIDLIEIQHVYSRRLRLPLATSPRCLCLVASPRSLA